MASNSDNRKLNPQVRQTTIGLRTLRKIKIYPLSVGDQLELSDLIIDSLTKYNEIVADEKKPDMQVFSEIANFIVNLIKENLDSLIEKITDRNEAEEDVHILDDVTNEQAIEIGKIVYEINFESLIKNVKSLFKVEEMELPLKRQSQPSVKPTGATGSNTSTGTHTKKVVSRTKKS